MLLSLERANAWALLFARLIATLCFFPKPFYFFFNRIARYTQSKESINLFIKIPQITGKAIFRNCLKNFHRHNGKTTCAIYTFFAIIHIPNPLYLIPFRAIAIYTLYYIYSIRNSCITTLILDGIRFF